MEIKNRLIQAYRQAMQIYVTVGSLPLAVQMAMVRVRLRLWEDGLEKIPHWADPGKEILIAELPIERLPVSVREVQQVTLARLHLFQGHPGPVLSLAEQVSASAEPGGRLMRVIEVSILKAIALHQLGESREAGAALLRALDLAESEGYQRIFLDEGEPMRQILLEIDHALSREAVSPVEQRRSNIHRLLSAFPAAQTAPAPQSSITTLPEPLSERELEVLRLVGEGYTNQEIASRLYVSLNTIKKHTSNIFGKLGATSRTQAVTLARQLGILTDRP